MTFFPTGGYLMTPKLRFPEFEGEWRIQRLEDFIDVISGIALKSDDITELEEGTPILRGINITEGFIRHSKEIDRFYPKIVNEKLEKYILKINDLVIGMDGSKVGKNVALIDKKNIGSILIQRVARIRVLNSGNINFIFQKIFSNEFIKYVDLVNTSSGIPHISLQQIKDFKTSFPVNIIEQEKIASFLSLLDFRIQTQKKIISQLKSQMSYLKDLIFEQKINFKTSKGELFPKWTEFQLSDLGNTFNGLSGKTKEHFGSGQKYIQYKQIFDSDKINVENCAFVNIDENENQNAVQYGDLFFTISSETPNEIGMSSVLLDNVDNIFLNSFCFGFRTHSFDELIPEFSRFLFRTKKVRNEIIKLAQGSTRYNMSKNGLLKLKIIIPSKEEQTKIAKFLSELDEKISLETKLLNKYENQKKYLLQNLFV